MPQTPRLALTAILACLLMPLPTPARTPASPNHREQVIAYIFPKDQLLTADQVPAEKLTRINYAFSNIKDGEIIEGFSHDAENYAFLVSLKQRNPRLQVLTSVGGWGWSGQFSDTVLTPATRARFIDSVVRFLDSHHLDGLDIDWEYPGLVGAGNKFRPEDRENYTAVLRELRSRFDREEKRTHRHLLLSVATGGNADFLEHTDMRSVARLVDTVNLMTYDFYGPDSDHTTGHHSPLFTNPADPKAISSQHSVEQYEAAGVPASKLVLGLPFYGKSWSDVGPANHGLFQPGSAPKEAFHGYNSLVGLEQQGYTRYWDPVSKVPWLYNPDSKTFITYEDPESLAGKCRFVLDHHLAGVMFWELSEDSGGALLSAIDSTLHPSPAYPGHAAPHDDKH